MQQVYLLKKPPPSSCPLFVGGAWWQTGRPVVTIHMTNNMRWINSKSSTRCTKRYEIAYFRKKLHVGYGW